MESERIQSRNSPTVRCETGANASAPAADVGSPDQPALEEAAPDDLAEELAKLGSRDIDNAKLLHARIPRPTRLRPPEADGTSLTAGVGSGTRAARCSHAPSTSPARS